MVFLMVFVGFGLVFNRLSTCLLNRVLLANIVLSPDILMKWYISLRITIRNDKYINNLKNVNTHTILFG